MSDARSQILAGLRQSERTGRVPAVATKTIPDRPRPSPDECLERFLTELTALGVTSYVERSASAVRARVTELVAERSVLSWDSQELPYGLGSVLPGSIQPAAAASVGVTGCTAAVAASGTLMLLAGPGRPRVASLLPPTHIAIVRRDQLRFSLLDVFGEFATEIAATSCCNLITGPSRTADIELTLTVGVHGPGKVIVVVGP